MFPCIWKTTGLHSGSPPNWKTNLGSGSDRTTRCKRAEGLLVSFPSFNHPFWNTLGRDSAPSKLIITWTRPKSFPELTPQVRPMRPVYTDTRSVKGLPESRRSRAESRWNPAEEMVESGDGSPPDEQSGSRAVCDGKFFILSLQKQGVVEGCTPEPAGLVACGSFRASDSTMSRTNGHGSILLSKTNPPSTQRMRKNQSDRRLWKREVESFENIYLYIYLPRSERMSAESSIFNIARALSLSLDFACLFCGILFSREKCEKIGLGCGMCQWVEKIASVVGISRGEEDGTHYPVGGPGTAG